MNVTPRTEKVFVSICTKVNVLLSEGTFLKSMWIVSAGSLFSFGCRFVPNVSAALSNG